LLDALKTALSAAGVYKFALAAISAGYWFVASRGIIPGVASWEIRASAFGAILFAGLWVANVISAALTFLPPGPWVIHWFEQRRERVRIRAYIPFMSEKERLIIGYLLAKNQKVFIADMDGGCAMPLISQRIIVRALQPGQIFDPTDTPMVIPDLVWEVLVSEKEKFPYAPTPNAQDELYPWRRAYYERI
jgi:hypothetical protein